MDECPLTRGHRRADEAPRGEDAFGDPSSPATYRPTAAGIQPGLAAVPYRLPVRGRALFRPAPRRGGPGRDPHRLRPGLRGRRGGGGSHEPSLLTPPGVVLHGGRPRRVHRCPPPVVPHRRAHPTGVPFRRERPVPVLLHAAGGGT